MKHLGSLCICITTNHLLVWECSKSHITIYFIACLVEQEKISIILNLPPFKGQLRHSHTHTHSRGRQREKTERGTPRTPTSTWPCGSVHGSLKPWAPPPPPLQDTILCTSTRRRTNTFSVLFLLLPSFRKAVCAVLSGGSSTAQPGIHIVSSIFRHSYAVEALLPYFFL